VSEVIYVYPQWHTVSFTLVAKQHIHYLRKVCRVVEVDETWLDAISCAAVLGSGKRYLLHPLFYMLFNRDTARRAIRATADKLVGFEVTDTDRISDRAVEIANEADLLIVPSHWSREVMKRSGVKVPVEVVQHGVSELYERDVRFPTSSNLLLLRFLKRERNFIYVLFFLHHSGFRKGADLVFKVMERIQRKHSNVILIVKRANVIDPYLLQLRKLKMIEVGGWLSEEDLIDLYDTCDILLCLSRGGGFELNALEALARGLITVVPDAGCFKEYIKYCVPVRVTAWVRIFRDNPIHVGLGFQADVSDCVAKLEQIIDNINEYRARFMEQRRQVLREFSWRAVCKKLINVLRQYRVVEVM